MSYRTPLIALIVFLVVSILTTWVVYITLNRGIGGPTAHYSALFTDVSGLRPGDDVRMAGVRVGRVTDIELRGTRAEVGFDVQRDQMLYGNTLAAVTYQNLIGQRYLGLSMDDFGDPRVLVPGAQIPIQHTQPSFDLSNLLNGFEPLFSTLKPEDVDNISVAVVRALSGNDGAVATLIAETSRLAETFAGPDQVLGTIIDNLAAVVTQLAQQRGNMQLVIGQTRKIFDGLAQRRDALIGQVSSISSTLSRMANAARGDVPALQQFLTRRPGFSQHFLDNKSKLAFLGFNLPPMLKAMARIVDNGAYLNAYPCNIRFDAIPGVNPVLDTMLNAATVGGRTEHSAICR